MQPTKDCVPIRPANDQSDTIPKITGVRVKIVDTHFGHNSASGPYLGVATAQYAAYEHSNSGGALVFATKSCTSKLVRKVCRHVTRHDRFFDGVCLICADLDQADVWIGGDTTFEENSCVSLPDPLDVAEATVAGDPQSNGRTNAKDKYGVANGGAIRISGGGNFSNSVFSIAAEFTKNRAVGWRATGGAICTTFGGPASWPRFMRMQQTNLTFVYGGIYKGNQAAAEHDYRLQFTKESNTASGLCAADNNSYHDFPAQAQGGAVLHGLYGSGINMRTIVGSGNIHFDPALNDTTFDFDTSEQVWYCRIPIFLSCILTMQP
jgi:hypothetical protein